MPFGKNPRNRGLSLKRFAGQSRQRELSCGSCASDSRFNWLWVKHRSKESCCRRGAATNCPRFWRVCNGFSRPLRSTAKCLTCWKRRSWRAGRPPGGRVWTCGTFWFWVWCAWRWTVITTGWNIWPITMVCCGRSWASTPCFQSRRGLFTTRRFRKTFVRWMRSCCARSTSWWFRPGGSLSKKKKTVPLNRSGPRPTAMCWRPTCIFRPT